MDAVVALFQLVWAPVLACTVSCVYFLSWGEASLRERMALSAHGALVASLFALAWTIGATGNARQSLAVPFAFAFLFPAGLAVAALFRFQGSKAVHLLQVPLFASGLWVWFVGTQAITGKWL